MEPQAIVAAVSSVVAREAARIATSRLKAFFSSRGYPLASENAISTYLDWVASWSGGIQIASMTRSEDVDSMTIELGYVEAEVRFRSLNSDTELATDDLLADDEPYLITGDPGGGKTTAMKRICRVLLSEGRDAGDHWQYPVVVPLRNIPKSRGLICYLALTFGLQFELPSNVPLRELRYTIKCGGDSLFNVVVSALSNSRAVLLLDGLDEINPDERLDIEEEIQDLIHALRSKFILTARIGSVERTFESVRCVQLRPLNESQQRRIAALWTDDEGEQFFDLLSKRPYADLASRPLFLIRLITLYRRDRTLPFQACDVYERFVRILLEEWDRERDVKRYSRYANFGPDQKLRFLSALANYLLFETRSVVFDRRTLERAYLAVCHTYQLPELQAEQVVQEITSHTGLIVQSGMGAYEFSHLSLQEFLCAHYLLRDPLKIAAVEYLARYPAPAAIATSMSSNPSAFLALLSLSDGETVDLRSWVAFLRRLAYEGPRFTAGVDLGLASLAIMSKGRELGQALETAILANNDGEILTRSVAKTIGAYELRLDTDVRVEELGELLPLHKATDLNLPRHLRQPDQLLLASELFIFASSTLGCFLPVRLADGAYRQLYAGSDKKMRVRQPPSQQWRPPSVARGDTL